MGNVSFEHNYFTQVMFLTLNNLFICRKWDLDSRCPVQSIEFPSVPTDMELSEDEKVLLVTYGDKIALYDARTLVFE